MGEQTRILKEKAGKFAAKGQNKRAIQEYEKLLERKPDDAWTLHRIAELWARMKNKDQAVNFFIQAAEGYSREGFSDRAVAVFKQALTVNPVQLEAYMRLADEFMTRGFERDAVGQLLRAAAVFEERGMPDQELEVLLRAVDMVPEDLDGHMRLARLYVRTEQLDKAREEFLTTAWELKKAKRMDEFVLVADRAIRLGEKSLKLHHALADNYLQRDEWQNALQILELPLRLKSDNLKTLALSARAYLGMNRPDRAVDQYKRLARLANAKGKASLAEEALERVRQITEQMRVKESSSVAPPPLPPCEKPEPKPEPEGLDEDYQRSLDEEPYEGEDTAESPSMAKFAPGFEEDTDRSNIRDDAGDDLITDPQSPGGKKAEDDWMSDADRIAVDAEDDPWADETHRGDPDDMEYETRETTMMVAIEDLLAKAAEAADVSNPGRKITAVDPVEDAEFIELLAEADFFIGQGLLDEAKDVLDGLDAKYLDHAETADRLEEINRLMGIVNRDDTRSLPS